MAVNGWPVSWHPQLQHAPSGRSSGLWAATVEGNVVNFDGTSWTQQPGDAVSVAAGKDGSVFAVGKSNQQQLSQWSGTAFTLVAHHSSSLSQVSVGGQNQVWTRDSNDTVNQLSQSQPLGQGQLQPVALAGSAAHIAANDDGTLWSCTGQDAQAMRFAPDLQQPPAAIAAAATVQKVASTGFGTAHCLAGDTLYSYDSPYVFRTPDTYNFTTGQAIEQGLGSLFFLIQSHEDVTGQPAPTYQVVAMDVHTGVELSRSAVAPPNVRYTAPAFDALHEQVIVGLTTNTYAPGPQQGQLLGLDARNLSTVLWSITLPNYTNNPTAANAQGPMPLGPGRPTLQGTQLCVSDNNSTLVMYDTGVSPTPTTPTYKWTYSFPISAGLVTVLPPPVLANRQVYGVWWLFQPSFGYMEPWLCSLDAATGAGSGNGLPTGPGGYYYDNDPRSSPVWASASPSMAEYPPLLAAVPVAGANPPVQTHQMLFINGGTRVWGYDIDANTATAYVLPGSTFGPNNSIAGPGAKILSGLNLGKFANVNSNNPVLWFGDSGSNVHAVSCQNMTALPNWPFAPGSGAGIATTPVLYTDAQDETAVLVSVTGATQSALLVVDPSSQMVVTVPTQGTNLISLSTTVTNGVVYGGGGQVNSGSANAPSAQVFGIRVDQAVQELRDFIVDSQLMQDFDEPAVGQQDTYAGVARYQTHLTLVDDTRAPLANEAVKLWADQANTIVLVNGQSYTLGPDDDQYASVKTSPQGQLVIVSGATTMNAVPLRAWASFMNPYERMLIIRDQEFHNRVATAHSTDPSQAGADDPTRANLQTSQKYGDLKNQGDGTTNPLFTAQQKADNQPQQVANAIQTMTGAVGTTPASGSKTVKASFSLHATESAASYIAYTDTPGVQYSPVNVATNRAAVVLNTTGFSYSLNTSGTPTFSMSNPAAATIGIDALQGNDWSTSPLAQSSVQRAASVEPGRASLLGDDPATNFWDWLAQQIVNAAVTVTHIIVSVAEDIYAGIRILFNDVAYVFTTIINGIEEAVNAIGAFFVELGHLIEEVIEALSVLFQFSHIIDTQKLLLNEFTQRIQGVPGNPNYPGLASLLQDNVTTPLNGIFTKSEEAVSAALNSMAAALGTNSPQAFPGGGSTAHSAFTATPNSGGASSSTATQGTWGMNKFNAGAGSSSSTSSLGASAPLQDIDAATSAVMDFFTNFLNQVTGSGPLNSQWAQVKSGAQSLSHTTSAADFLKQGLGELLNILALLVDGALAVANGLVDGLFGVIDDVFTLMFGTTGAGGQPGFLTTTLPIPVLSWLYQLLFNQPLTLLNALTLVISIPVTIMWRIIEGQWPADTGLPTTALVPGLTFGAELLADTPPVPAKTQQLLALTNLFVSFVGGIVNGAGDSFGSGNEPLIIGRGALLLSLLSAAITAPNIYSDSLGVLDWSSWGLTVALALTNILSSVDLSHAPQALELGRLGTALESALSVAELLVLGLYWDSDYGEAPTNPLADAALGINMITTLPGLINPIKLLNGLAAIVVAVLDVVMGIAAGVAEVLSVKASTEGARLPLNAGHPVGVPMLPSPL